MPITWSVLRWMDPWPGGYIYKTSEERGSFESEQNTCEQTCHYDIAGTVCPPAAWTGARVSTPGAASRVSTSPSPRRFTLSSISISTISISTISTPGGGGGPLHARHPRVAAEPGDGAAAGARGHAALGTRHVPPAAPGQVTHYTCLIMGVIRGAVQKWKWQKLS